MSRLRVLLADDHRIVAQGLARLLEAEFDLVAIVEDGTALVAAAREHRPDIVVADIGMPGLNGIAAIAPLKKNDPDVRIVILTMHREVAYALQALKAGAHGYVLKHSAREELLMAVHAAAERRTFIAPAIAADVLKAAAGGKPTAAPGWGLTPRQREILSYIAKGYSAKQIAARLDISPRTVEFHKYTIKEALGVKNNAELIRFALRSGVLDP